MITAVDTNILLDLLVPEAPHQASSERKLQAALEDGAVILSEAVYAELGAHFSDEEDLRGFSEDTGIRLVSSSPEALVRAGRAWAEYARRGPRSFACPACGAELSLRCERCGRDVRSRQHVLADFLIGAHATVHADRLLTRDRGYYERYFPELTLL